MSLNSRVNSPAVSCEFELTHLKDCELWVWVNSLFLWVWVRTVNFKLKLISVFSTRQFLCQCVETSLKRTWFTATVEGVQKDFDIVGFPYSCSPLCSVFGHCISCITQTFMKYRVFLTENIFLLQADTMEKLLLNERLISIGGQIETPTLKNFYLKLIYQSCLNFYTMSCGMWYLLRLSNNNLMYTIL